MAASNKTLGDLHEKLARVLADALDGAEREEVIPSEDPDAEPTVVRTRIPPGAAVMAVVAKFLKDNSIFGDVENDEHLKELKEKLRSRLPTDKDVREAMAEVGRSLLQ